MQERCNFIAYILELCLSCTKPSICWLRYSILVKVVLMDREIAHGASLAGMTDVHIHVQHKCIESIHKSCGAYHINYDSKQHFRCNLLFYYHWIYTLIASFMGSMWGPPGADRTQVGPMLAPWTLLSGQQHNQTNPLVIGELKFRIWNQRARLALLLLSIKPS